MWFRVRNVEMPWGDYGAILLSGMTGPPDADGRLSIERTGPFVPSITVAGVSDVVVTDAFRAALEESGLAGLAFRETVLERIVRLDWRSWNLDAEDPERYPAGGEPENYILGRKHDPETAAEVGPLWELVVQRTLADPGDADFVRTASSPFSRVLTSERGRAWLDRHAGQWLSFEPDPPG